MGLISSAEDTITELRLSLPQFLRSCLGLLRHPFLASRAVAQNQVLHLSYSRWLAFSILLLFLFGGTTVREWVHWLSDAQSPRGSSLIFVFTYICVVWILSNGFSEVALRLNLVGHALGRQFLIMTLFSSVVWSFLYYLLNSKFVLDATKNLNDSQLAGLAIGYGLALIFLLLLATGFDCLMKLFLLIGSGSSRAHPLSFLLVWLLTSSILPLGVYVALYFMHSADFFASQFIK